MATLLKRALLSEAATTSTEDAGATNTTSTEHGSTEHEEFSELDSLITYEVRTPAYAAVAADGLMLPRRTCNQWNINGLPMSLHVGLA
jgi:hypothetical protein